MYHQEIINLLLSYKNSLTDFFKIRAYDKVICNIKKIKEPITSFKQIENIEGVGKSIKIKLKEIFDKIEKDTLIHDLLQIYGVGIKKANELIDIHKISSINDLKKNTNLLTKAQKIGLYCYNDLLERIPRKEMLEHEKILKINDNIEIVGSFRRKEDNSGDIDVMLCMNIDEFNDYINYLIKIKYIKFILAKGDKKMLGICSLNKNRRLDLIRNTKEEYPFMKLYFTGPKEFNIKFRKHCLTKGLSLNENTFKPFIKGIKTEKDIFKYVGLKYIEPEDRK